MSDYFQKISKIFSGPTPTLKGEINFCMSAPSEIFFGRKLVGNSVYEIFLVKKSAGVNVHK